MTSIKAIPTEKELIARLESWAADHQFVRTAILTGSRVNPQPVVDVLSDYDIELYVDDLSPFWASDDWLEDFGDVMVKCPFAPASYKKNWLTRMAVFEQGFRIDFQLSDGPLLNSHYIDGFRVIFDRDHEAFDLPLPSYQGYLIQPPGRAQWDKLVNEFWWDVIYIAKSLARDELFYAKYMSEREIRFSYIQKLLEWKICLDHGWHTQPNKYGRFFRRYLSAQLWQQVEQTFAAADIDENWQALFNLLTLFRALAMELGEAFGFDYPHKTDKQVTETIQQIHSLELQSAAHQRSSGTPEFGNQR